MMIHAKLGKTGLDVSRLCLGCMPYAKGPTASHGWSYDEYTGRDRIVLPEGEYAGLHKDEIEIIKGRT